MASFSCATGGRFRGAESFPRRARKNRISRREGSSTVRLLRRIPAGGPPSLTTGFGLRAVDGGRGGLLTGPLARGMRGGKARCD